MVTFLPSKEEPRFRLPEGALKKGVVAQMVERALSRREVVGSTPSDSIILFLIVIVPGLPTIPFIFLSVLAGAASYFILRKKKRLC